MAAKQRKIHSAKTGNGREIMRPIISSDVMGNRNVEVVPVGAWVEPSYEYCQLDAVEAAKLEEDKIKQMRHEKENRLQSFQCQVKKRVSHANQVKRQHQIHQAEKAFELERKVVQQSYEMGTSSRKDTCSMRNDDLEHAIRLRLLKKYGEDVDQWETERQKEFSNDKNLKVSQDARQQLGSKKISQSQSSEFGNLRHPLSTAKVSREIQTPTVTAVVEVNPIPLPVNGIKPYKLDCEDLQQSSDDEEEDHEENEDDEMEIKQKPTVQFRDLKEQATSQSKTRRKKSAASKRSSSAQLAAMLSDFTESEAMERQRRQQAAISRRIFMDREREAVREGMRRQEHRRKIVRLKKEKEAYRQQLESMAQKAVDVQQDESEEENEEELRQRLEAVHFDGMVERRREELKRSREMERYLDALRHKLKEKARRLSLQLPALCACGDIWDTHPETCANNCFFYKNNRAYARTLQSLLASTEVM